MKPNLFYFPLEPLEERYTAQLSLRWIPDSFKKYSEDINFIVIDGENISSSINVGMVLDAVGRGKYSLSQCNTFLSMIAEGKVKDNDIIFLQDFWTPGIESIFYALDLYKIKNIKIYATCWAQSVDEYDFTYQMKDWMRFYELGLDSKLTGIFVGNAIHRDQLKAAGFKAPIHVVSLTINLNDLNEKLQTISSLEMKENTVIFTSRFDSEKNPLFMLEVAKKFLKLNPDWNWLITTSASKLRSNDEFIIKKLNEFANEEPRFKIKVGLTKLEYYTELAKAKIQFNSSLQDYVSWTLIEATFFGCDICYPNFRSFPEIINKSRLYDPFVIDSSLEVLKRVLNLRQTHYDIPQISDMGRQLLAYIITFGFPRETNIWHEYEYFNFLLDDKK